MATAKKLRPNQELAKLKSWKGGRHSQLRLFIGHLESAFHSSLAAQVAQSNKRKFSEFVPKIVSQDISTELEYREFRVAWNPPKGLRDFLFYELQLSTTSNFSNFDAFISYDPFFVFPNLLDGRTYYSRIRVVSKDGLFGPWSDNIEVTTPYSQVFGLFDGREITSPIFNLGNFQPLFTRDYTAIGGNIYYSLCYDLQVQGITSTTKNVSWADCEFQWKIDGNQVGQNFYVTAYGLNRLTVSAVVDTMDVTTADIGTAITDSLRIEGAAGTFYNRRGTFSQKFTTISAGDHTIELFGRVIDPHPTPNDWIQSPFDASTNQFLGIEYGVGAFIKLKNFNIFETLVS